MPNSDGFTHEQMRLIQLTADVAVTKAIEAHRNNCPLADKVELTAWRGIGKLFFVLIGSSGITGATAAWIMNKLSK